MRELVNRIFDNVLEAEGDKRFIILSHLDRRTVRSRIIEMIRAAESRQWSIGDLADEDMRVNAMYDPELLLWYLENLTNEYEKKNAPDA